jgi:formylglycine-generating enzyme required for sulfatase activity
VDAATEQKCREAFLATMTSDASAVLRCRVGSTLGRLGDPRFHDERLWCLPRDPMLGFVEIEADKFVMGTDETTDPDAFDDEKPQHRIRVSRYLIARYPVTVAQFAAFAAAVKANGYEPADPRSVQGVANHPVAYVTWYDALAYCRWLGDSLRTAAAIPDRLRAWLESADGWRVTLPSEPEWERAARGPSGRRYPWGDEFDPDRANTNETQVGSASPVGAFPGGATPEEEGRVNDLSGNVWEWTRSHFRPYPYASDDGREDLTAGDDVHRVVRGGSFRDLVIHARAAARYGYYPSSRNDFIGFRVVVSCLRS